MNNISSDETDLLNIGYGLQIGLAQPGTWKVCGKNGCFDLREANDFWRVVILLEHSFSEIESIIDSYVKKIGSKDRFPYWKVVSAGLSFEVDQWANLALAWFPHLEQDEKNILCDLLDSVKNSKWASQKSRQLANRYAKQIRLANS
jgi:hypothetical protein